MVLLGASSLDIAVRLLPFSPFMVRLPLPFASEPFIQSIAEAEEYSLLSPLRIIVVPLGTITAL